MNHFIRGRQAKVLGRSIPLTLVLFLMVMGVAIAGIFAVMRVGLEGNIKEVLGPTMTAVSTNDDGIIDYATFDANDDGLDPSGVTVAGGAPRFAYDMQTCTAQINGNGMVDVLMTDTYNTAFCSIRVSVTNETSDTLYLVDALFSGAAPLETVLNSGSACGYVLNPLENGSVIVDIWPIEGAAGSWVKAENTIDVRWGLAGTFVCS